MMAVAVKQDAQVLDTGAQTHLFDVRVPTNDLAAYSVTPDGRRFLVNTVVSDTSQPIVVVMNWTAALKK